VLIGRNGRGKSRVLHALVEIFGSLWRRESATFAYKVRYSKADAVLTVAQDDRTASPSMHRTVDGISREVSARKLWQRSLPDHVFAYQALAHSAWDGTLDLHEQDDLRTLRSRAKDMRVPLRLRPMQSCRTEQLPLILIALAPLWDERFRPFTRANVGLERIVEAELQLRRPTGYRGNAAYWGLTKCVANMLAELAASGRFGRIPDDGVPGSAYETMRIDLASTDDFLAFIEAAGSEESLFAVLELLRAAGILTARVRLELTDGTTLYPDELSAGEQQILTTLGMVRLQRESESLFLMDEPNAHFHPGWSQRWPDLVREVLEDGQRSQFIAATHEPLLVANVSRQQIRVLRERDGTIVAETPEVDPRGRGVGGILTSELYGLPTHLDLSTQEMLDAQYDLLGRPLLTADDQAELADLTSKLDDLDFAVAHRDPTVSAFLAELDRRRRALIREAGSQDVNIEAVARLLFDERFQGL
jgi:energy-coupling factor transporter ATP-binding protein EcfA2